MTGERGADVAGMGFERFYMFDLRLRMAIGVVQRLTVKRSELLVDERVGQRDGSVLDRKSVV